MKASNVATFFLVVYLLLAPQGLARGDDAQGQPRDWQGDNGGLRYRAAPGSDFQVPHRNRLNLISGEILVEATGSGVVSCPVAEVYVKRRSVVLFVARQGTMRCQVLWDAGIGSVTIICHKHRVKLGPGDEALVTDHDPDYREIMMSDDIGRRRIKVHNLVEGKAITTAEFSLLQALERDPLLYDVFHSSNPHDKSLLENILKTAAVLDMVTAGHGYYSNKTGY
ncbi:MAG: hypothetical protein HY711_03640 [Candidatus Melainabacteria bacterium]|nr:hypothetical protein [Candidatus Melainabacteria bacterium]